MWLLYPVRAIGDFRQCNDDMAVTMVIRCYFEKGMKKVEIYACVKIKIPHLDTIMVTIYVCTQR